ncbi:hypothetical protein [Streptomyces sp. NBC_01367]|uniref:hypothetical protein n=1 Tax=Streptomyces sp. NBC_01367 TaxID=2903841 RepID=UPI00386D7A5D
MSKEPTGEGECERQSSEAVSDLRGVFECPGVRCEVAEHEGGVLAWEHTELE